ncbi:MAG TPA: VWA domain-containing protein [Streptosporangiaceae bacterium]|nr:VWA domain-containing protein [Streptosporangiaceae bacterium]
MNMLPGGRIASRPLHFIWILDCSGSMDGDKIRQLNFAIREALPAMKDTADENPNAQVLMRAVTFSTGARWHVGTPTPVDGFSWTDVAADGVTDMGKALSMVADQLKIPPMSDRALPPVLVLVSDGQPTDDFSTGLKALMDQPWGKRSVRLAIAVGRDADLDVLSRFIGMSELKPLQANNAPALVSFIRWASTAVLKAVSSPASHSPTVYAAAGQGPNVTVAIPPAPAAAAGTAASDVW